MSNSLHRCPPIASNKRTHSQSLRDEMEEHLDSALCPNIVDGNPCGEILTKKMKFCSECGWSVKPSIFQRIIPPSDSGVYICDGLDDEEQVCGKEVLTTMKFCPHCGNRRKKVSRSVSGDSIDVSSAMHVAGHTQTSKSLVDVGKSETVDNERVEETNIPENSSKIPVVGEGGSQLSGEVEGDLTSRSQSSTDDGMASRSESNQEFDSPREVAMETIDSGELGESLSTADDSARGKSSEEDPNAAGGSDGCAENRAPGDSESRRFKTETTLMILGSGNVEPYKRDGDQTTNSETIIDPTVEGTGDASGVKKLNRTNSAEQSTLSGSKGPESASVSPASQRTQPRRQSESESGSNDGDQKTQASYADSVTSKRVTRQQTAKNLAQQSDRSQGSDGQQSGADTMTTVTSQDGKSTNVSVRVLQPKNEREERYDYSVPAKNSSKGPPKGQAYQSKVAVHFHVVVSKEEFSSYKRRKGDKVIILFEDSGLGGWQDTRRVMKEEKAIDDKTFLMVLDMEMDKYLVTSGRLVKYKYAILHGGDGKPTVEFEFVPKKSRSIVNRELKIPYDRLTQGMEWHQYDGIMSQEPEGGLLSFFSEQFGKVTGKYYEQFMKRTKTAVTAMLPSWNEIQGTDSQSARNMLEKLDQICYCVKNSFMNEKLTPDESKMREFLEEFVEPAIRKLQSQIGRELHESEAEAGIRLALACSLVYVLQKYELKFDSNTTKAIFHALLLRPDSHTKTCHDYQQLIEVHFPTEPWKKEIAKNLLYFMSRMATKDFIEPMWLLAVPLLHFLDDYVKPGCAPKTDLTHRSVKWWGIGNFKVLVDSFKSLNAKSMPLMQYLELLSPLFEQDRLLPRTLMSVMSLEHIPYLYETKLIPMDVCLANAFYFANTENDGMTILPALQKLEGLSKTCLSGFDPSDATKLEEKMDELYIQKKLSYEVLETVCVRNIWLRSSPVIITAAKIAFNIISNMQQLQGIAEKTEGIKEIMLKKCSQAIQSSIDEVTGKTFSWLSRNSSYILAVIERDQGFSYPKIDYEEVQMFGYMCEVEFFDNDTAAYWKRTLEQHMTRRLKMLAPNLQILVFGDVDFSKYPPEVEACFSKAAFDVLENVDNTRNADYGYMFDQLDKVGSASKLQHLLSHMFEKSWPREENNLCEPSSDEAAILHHILTWPSFKRYLKLFYGRSRKTGLLSENCVTCIQTGMSVFDAVLAKLLNGTMSVLQLKLLLDEKMKKNFLDLFEIIEQTFESGMKNVPESGIPGINKCAVLMKVLVWRQTELRSFEDYCLRVNYFHGLCTSLKSVELDELRNLSAWKHEKLLVSDFCQPRLYSVELAQDPKYQPKVIYFSISLEGETMLAHLWKMKTSIIFNDMWNRSLKKMGEKQNPCSFSHVLEIWKFCFRHWNKFSDEIRNGDLTFARVDAIFASFDRKYDSIEKELALVIGKDVAVERTKQIEQYHRLDQYSRGASIMLKLQNEFELTGDFSTAEILVDMVKDKSKALREITDQLVDSGKQLEEITDERVECLEVFLKHKKFADWLCKSVKGPKEVKVLVDLAMISAEGQGDMEVEKVLCLNAAATGYAPLIYDLSSGMGFKEFLPLCQQVWRLLDNDPALPRKFRDTALQLDWLNRVKESHGSVELNALANAQAINAKGIYSVGNLGRNRKTLDGVLELKLRLEKGDRDIDSSGFVSEEAERGKWQSLNLQQLNDLQSKLMLVAGKAQEGKKEVDNFVEILDGVTRLGNLYIRICNAGCSLFHHWKAIFYCDPSKPMFARVEFGKDGKHIFCGLKKDATNGVCGYILDLCTFMEDCLKEWLEHIERQRVESYYLNYYTTEQLVILQNELPKINMDKTQISRNIYPILSLVKRNCTLNNVEDAMHSAFRRLEEMERRAANADQGEEMESENITMEVDKDAEVQECQQQHESAKRFIREMVDAGFCQKLAVLALKEHGPDNIEEGILWCLDKNSDFLECDDSGKEESDMEEGSSVDRDHLGGAKQSRTPIQYTGLHLEKTMDSLTSNLFKDPTLSNKLESLTKKLGELWRMYQNEMNTSLADYLSVRHLGCTLDCLAAMDNARMNRSLPGYMKKGKPNLILCSRAEILAVVLSIYMSGARKNPLPGIDEVLVCNATTTAEDVELLWRRAEGDARNDRHGKIYCLVHAELLDYDVARKAEQSLDKHSHAAEAIQLVVVCCREQEDRSHMINALDRYRVKVPPVELQEVRTYLQEHLAVRGTTTVRPAADLDPDRCSVRVIKSHRAGVGKSLKVRRLLERRQEWGLPNQGYDGSFLISIPLHCKVVDPSVVLRRLIQHSVQPHVTVPRIFHIDIAHEVQEGVDYLLFNLLILGSITDREGFVWTRAPTDLYLIETMPLMQREAKNPERRQQELQYVHHIFQLLPTLTCWSPTDSVNILSNELNDVKDRYTNAVVSVHDQKMDDKEFRGAMFQRPFKYLVRFTANQELHRINCQVPEGTFVECIRCLLTHCGIRDPSWSELRHFVNFLNVQLSSCEQSIFCSDFLAPDLPGFLKFVVQFMIQMSQDFATRSLTISEETPEVALQLLEQDDRQADEILGGYGLKRRWETSPHPYLFFNADGNSFTFMGFIINVTTGDILEPGTNRILAPGALPKELSEALIRNRVDLSENFDALPRWEKIMKMCRVIGIDLVHDPDSTYELTADNVKKMLAIYMRFRCDIPVIVMGETGCGKTRLIKFMCDLWRPPGSDLKNMILMKVHGGSTANDIERKVREAAKLARTNRDFSPDIQTVLFFDEANTTEAIGMIKEIMCDHTIGGEKLPSTYGLKLIAACNPYRKHSDAMIMRLEHAGLGYHIQAHQTADKLGRIPMRQLVYRVQSLPQSMLPLVWDFGQLSTEVETLYIRQMVNRYITDIPVLRGMQLEDTVARILAASQEFMRQQKDECSFVSLRDVDRALQVMMWFYPREKELFDKMNDKAVYEMQEAYQDQGPAPVSDDDEEIGDDEEPDNGLVYIPPHDWTRALILALGVCYHGCLQKRKEYREFIARYFVAPCQLENGAQTIEKNINWCQDVFLDEVELGENIARNQALKENLFMMVICIELRIPLFLVGKPGSSKSLAKTIVADAMQGEAARSELFRTLKSVHMVSYQCSPLSTPEGIVGTFRQCAKLQEGQDLNKFVSVVVLDEVGLAEDSDRMPLKTLHPLLEDGCEGDEVPAPHKKVGFIGISNWALDPAKMNRGILVQRGVPDEQELEQSAKGICAKDGIIARQIDILVQPMSKAYLELYESALKIREFFGLRDFYSLIKMVYGFMKRSGEFPTWAELQHAILRNFGGLDDIHPVKVFEKHLHNVDKNQPPKRTDPACDSASLIRCSLTGEELDSESRYLLILTENYAALGLLQHELLKIKDAIIIFGSSFPKDQEYTQVCRNINRIKVCMETGRTVVLLNLENLYESLYDALNQYYVRFGDQRFVDLGLGTQRVKCRVHQSFRLIVVAEKQVVYEKFPIPLINRLEKHFLAMSTMLTTEQMEIADRLSKWATDFTSVHGIAPRHSRQPKPADVFIGYHPDTAASLVLQVCHSGTKQEADLTMEKILNEAKDLLLRCAVPEAILRLNNTRLAASANEIYTKYFDEQCHSNLENFLRRILDEECPTESLFVQVTTHSRLLLPRDALHISKVLNMKKTDVALEALNAFGTEQQFCRMLREFFTEGQGTGRRVLLLQCDSGDVHAELIACARYNIWNEFCQISTDDEMIEKPLLHVIFIVQLPRIAGGCFVGFQGGKWLSYHIDDLHPNDERIPSLMALKGRSLGTLFEAATTAKDTEEPMEEEEEEEEEFDEALESIDDLGATNDTEDVPMETENIESEAVEERTEDGFELLTRKQRSKAREGVKFVKEKLESPESSLDVDSIIRSCLHCATAMLKDAGKEEALKLRKTHRLQLLMELLSESHAGEKQSLMTVLRKRLTLLLKDKEETAMTAVTANGWLSNEAASFEAICRAGTFRRALWQYLETRVTPLLAGVVAYVDTNANLDILTEEGGDNAWITSMWMDMFSNSDITIIKYKDLQTATQRMELTDFEVKTTGADGKFFVARLPFSWIIKEQVDRLIYAAKQDASKNTRILVEDTLQMSALGKVLEKTRVENKMEDVIRRYLSDFVRMVHKSHSHTPDVEYDLVIRDIEYAMRCQFLQEQDGEQDEDNFVDASEFTGVSIPRIHLTYESIRKQLTLFSELIQIWPECIRKLADPNIPKNMPLDLICLILLMEAHLLPMKDELDNINTRQRWVEKVRSASPIVVRLLESVSDITREHLARRDMCRFTWNRVGAVQLFIEHVCPGSDIDIGLSVKRCMPLWTALADRTDFKTLKSFETVENFLRICNKNAVDHYFGKVENCPGCEKPAEFPVKLPCGHFLCARCLVETKELKVFQCLVAACLKPFPKDIKAKVITAKNEGKEKYTLYKQRCNTFFMNLVSCFCFTDNTPPENSVIRKLMGYVTRKSKLAEKVGGEAQQKTKKMFEESIDPTPVVRSFLLQLMLQADIDSVHEYLEQYFENARTLVQTDPAQVVELCVLCVQCLEDHHHRQSTQLDDNVERLHFARNLLLNSTNLLHGDILGIQLDSLEAIARIRFGLLETARQMYKLYADKTTCTEVRRLCDAAKMICDQDKLKWPRIYLMRLLTRQYGIDALKSVAELPNLKWVIPREARGNENDAVPDRFVICGDNYVKLRELITEIVLGKSVESFEETLQATGESGDVVQCLALLAIYREVTTSIRANPQNRLPPEVIQRLENMVQQSAAIKNKDFAAEIIGNRITGGTANRADILTELIVHFKILLTNSKNNGLQKPFIDILNGSRQLLQSFLPTMPQDEIDDIRAAIGVPVAGEVPTFYQCPNGHPYVIGNCGQPNQTSKCPVCQAGIGGVNHQPAPGNARLVRTDMTRPGHVLGQPQKRAPIPERQMSPASTAVLRLLLHLSMYLSSLEDPQVVAQVIFPPIQPQTVSQFLLDHARIDVETIHSATGHSEDDVIVFMHMLIDAMLRNDQIVDGIGDHMRLANKASRIQFENTYVNTHITPVLNGLDARLQDANRKMVNDERLGNNPLLRTVFEVDAPLATVNIQRIHQEPSLWRYRSHISLEHLAHALEENMAQTKENEKKKPKLYPILQLFLKDEHQLRAVRLLPKIIRLHRLLLQRLNRCLDSSDATTMTVGTFLDDIQDDGQRQDLHGLILNDFSYAWDCIRPSLTNYAFSGYTIPLDYTQEPVNETSRLAMLLPSLRGWGLCSVALIYYLQELQNNFLENYSRERKQSLKTRVDIYDASYAHFVAYHPVHDLQPIILANCNYSLEVGKGTTIEYDFGSMEKQIVERFIRGRPRLGIERMEFILFREDFTNSAIFSQLRARIPQEPVPSQAELERELKHRLTNVTDLLASLNIAIGFLVSIGGDPEMNILRFMSDTLKMKQPEIAAMLQTCKLKHVESLWLLLSYLRARLQASYGQDAFENVDEKYREPVPDDLKPKLRLGFQHIQMDSFLIFLYECIVFNITVKQNVNAEDYVDNSDYALRDVLNVYMDESGSNYSIPALQDGRFPEEIRAKHCIATWLLALHPNRKA